MTVGLRILGRILNQDQTFLETLSAAFLKAQSPLGHPFDTALWVAIPLSMIFLTWVLTMLENAVCDMHIPILYST
jgi:hypothetical protein